ncbi:hypothetical protein AAMO2058_001402200, partial [Amorphochlora amoebiformis]
DSNDQPTLTPLELIPLARTQDEKKYPEEVSIAESTPPKANRDEEKEGPRAEKEADSETQESLEKETEDVEDLPGGEGGRKEGEEEEGLGIGGEVVQEREGEAPDEKKGDGEGGEEMERLTPNIKTTGKIEKPKKKPIPSSKSRESVWERLAETSTLSQSLKHKEDPNRLLVSRLRTMPSDVSTWNVDTVITWLKELGSVYEQFEDAFRDNGVDGKVLIALNERFLEQMNITGIHSYKILLEVKLLREKSENYNQEGKSVQKRERSPSNAKKDSKVAMIGPTHTEDERLRYFVAHNAMLRKFLSKIEDAKSSLMKMAKQKEETLDRIRKECHTFIELKINTARQKFRKEIKRGETVLYKHFDTLSKLLSNSKKAEEECHKIMKESHNDISDREYLISKITAEIFENVHVPVVLTSTQLTINVDTSRCKNLIEIESTPLRRTNSALRKNKSGKNSVDLKKKAASKVSHEMRKQNLTSSPRRRIRRGVHKMSSA